MILDAETSQMFWILIFAVGAFLLFAAIFKKTSTLKLPQIPAAFIGFLMLVTGYVWGFGPYLGGMEAPIQTTPIVIDTGEDALPATFSIEPVAVITNIWDSAVGDCITTAVLDASEKMLTVPVTVTTGGTHDAIAVNYTAWNFTVTPIPPTGANADDLATIYFESDYNMKHENEYVLKHDGNVETFFANWTRATAGDTTSWDHSGQDTMLYTEDTTYQIAYGLNGGENALGNVFKTVGETITWQLTFHNVDWTWSQVYTVTCIVIASA
jgi:hypothetical protein